MLSCLTICVSFPVFVGWLTRCRSSADATHGRCGTGRCSKAAEFGKGAARGQQSGREEIGIVVCGEVGQRQRCKDFKDLSVSDEFLFIYYLFWWRVE